MQGLAHSAGACVQLLDHALDLLAQTDSVQVHAEHVGTAVQSRRTGSTCAAAVFLRKAKPRCGKAKRSAGGGNIVVEF